jgi:hypothetical protein
VELHAVALRAVMAPANQLLWVELPPPRHIRHSDAKDQRLCHDLCFLLRRPTSASTKPSQQPNQVETTFRFVHFV